MGGGEREVLKLLFLVPSYSKKPNIWQAPRSTKQFHCLIQSTQHGKRNATYLKTRISLFCHPRAATIGLGRRRCNLELQDTVFEVIYEWDERGVIFSLLAHTRGDVHLACGLLATARALTSLCQIRATAEACLVRATATGCAPSQCERE